MSTWQPIETAPKDGTLIIGWAEDFDQPLLLRWKLNRRIGKEYFGDPYEYDDYDLVESGPTHWMDIRPPCK